MDTLSQTFSGAGRSRPAAPSWRGSPREPQRWANSPSPSTCRCRRCPASQGADRRRPDRAPHRGAVAALRAARRGLPRRRRLDRVLSPLLGAANPTLSNTRTFANVTPGNGYSLYETLPSGWDQTGAACDDGSPVSNIDVAPGETVTCTFDNEKRATLVVVKDATPNDPQDFSFTAGGGLSPDELLRSTTTPTGRCSHANVQRPRCRIGLFRSPRPCRAAGTRPAPHATTAARSRTSRCPPARP